MPLENIVTVRGTLLNCFAQVKPETILHADETQKRRIADAELRKLGAWVGDGVAYEFEKNTGEAVLYLSRLPYNLVLNNLEEALPQIRKTGNYRPSKEAFEAMKGADSTLRIVISELELERDNGEFGHFAIDTKNPEQSNSARKAIAERVHGRMSVYNDGKNKQTSDYLQVMNMLGEKIKTTSICVLLPGDVRKIANEGPIARVCWFDFYYSYFVADGRNVVYDSGALRGVRREKVAAEGGARKIFPSYETVLDFSRPFIKEGKSDEFEKGLKELYKP